MLPPIEDRHAYLAMRACIQKVATGPEYSKDLAFDEAHEAMGLILEGKADPVQAAILLIALRMKRETDDEFKGALQAIKEASVGTRAAVDELVDVADPYDGHTRGLPAAPFLPAVFAALGVPAVAHGLERVGPKYGITSRKVLRAAGIDVDLSPGQVAERIADPDVGWGYVDQRHYCPQLHDLVPLRSRIVKRPLITTVEVLVGPIRGRKRTHLMTGYVHKAYPPIYAGLARYSGFDSAAIIRGVEGGVIPSLKQPAKVFYYHELGQESAVEIRPQDLGIEQQTRAVPLPEDLPPAPEAGDEIATPVDIDVAAERAAQAGIKALRGEAGPTRDSLVYGAAIMLHHLGRHESRAAAAEAVRVVLDSGKALAHLRAA